MRHHLHTEVLEMIKEAVEDTVDITQVLHPVYNFKAGNDN